MRDTPYGGGNALLTKAQRKSKASRTKGQSNRRKGLVKAAQRRMSSGTDFTNLRNEGGLGSEFNRKKLAKKGYSSTRQAAIDNSSTAARTAKSEKERSIQAGRAQRAKEGRYKGKYYGPDAFKGNLSKIDAWKKAGKPDIRDFNNEYDKVKGNTSRSQYKDRRRSM